MIVKHLSYNDIETPIIKINFDYSEYNKYHNEEEYLNLIKHKNKIDNIKDWDKSKKLSNDYELIHLPNKNVKGESIAHYEPLSRSYFKMWEILCEFNLLNSSSPQNYATLAEGPGGFIEAIINFRKRKNVFNDKIHAITLRSHNKDIPGWKKGADFLKRHHNINISYGEDGSGNLYNVENIKHFVKHVNCKMDLVTGDAGFDFSDNFNNQERMSLRIIFCEIVTALSIQNIGGSFICKFFDTYNNMTIHFINLLSFFYKDVYLTKPLTSRPANSEKYLLCKNFKGIDNVTINKLFIVIRSWEFINNTDKFMNSIFDNNIHEGLLKDVIDFNTITYNIQVKNIEKTLNIINNKSNLETLSNIIKKQTEKALEWCNKYGVKVNNNSNFLK